MSFLDRFRLGKGWLLQLGIVVGVSTLAVWLDDVVRGRQSTGYPNRPIEVVVPFGEGGSTDTFARTIKRAIEEEDLLPQPLVIINQGGAGATIGSRSVKDSDADGYTMLILHDTLFTAKAFGTVDYGAEAFEPIAATGESGMVIAVEEKSPYKTLSELMDDVAGRPSEIRYGNNIGALVHFAALYLAKLQNDKQESESPAKFRMVQSGGGSDRYEDLLRGETDVSGFSIDEFIRFRSGGLRGLAFLGAERHDALDDVPTAREQGYDLVHSNIFYWWFPKGTPQSRVNVIADALSRAMQSEIVKRFTQQISTERTYLRGEPLHDRIATSQATYDSVTVDEQTPLPNTAAIVFGAAVLLGVFVTGEAFFKRAGSPDVLKSETAEPARYDLAAIGVIFTVLYVGILTSRLVDFRIATSVFLFVLASLLTTDRRARWVMLPVSLVLSVVVFYVFTELFVVDLN